MGGLALMSFIQNHWPFASRKQDDVDLSNRLVNGLSIPDHTKQFVFAIVEPQTKSVVYILSAQNLSKQSALDAELLIKEVKPEVVVTQVAKSALSDILTEEKNNKRNGGDDGEFKFPVPTSLLGVLKGCFMDKIKKDEYESLAGSVLLKEIFGVGFYGHLLSAKRAAKEVGSSNFLIESPFVSTCVDDPNPTTTQSSEAKNKLQASHMNSNSLVAQNIGSGVSPNRLFSTSDLHTETMKSLVSALSQINLKPIHSGSVSEAGLGNCHPKHDYEAPLFAQTVYPLLTDLHNVFGNLPSIERALAYAQKILYSVDKGEPVDIHLLSEVQNFQIAVEGLRVGMNSAGQSHIKIAENSNSMKSDFMELSTKDKSEVLFAQAIRSQTEKFKSVVAIVDANSLMSLRKHWNTSVPPEVKDLIQQFITRYESEEISDTYNSDKKRLIPDKPVVAVGAGATAVLGASSLSKAVPASTFMKLVTYKIPASLKLALVQTQKVVAISFSKVFGPSKVVAPGLMTSGAKSTSIMNAATSTRNMRAVTHSVIAYAQRTSFSAMKMAFYEIMRKRRFQPIGPIPWVKFGGSVSACAALLAYGDGIECVVESVPVAPAIASLGRGLQHLHQANQVVRRVDGTNIQEAVQSLMDKSKSR
ncbi:transmembrane protein [Thalictrum thalictroides]|uniref:Transmembrane protein n=1 Tax=Thalictrum thalictroides TaxID=46969 RepID=A0A7J6WUX3_THATH|nr:transmembrane protein [Thalictrum thalictroides]